MMIGYIKHGDWGGPYKTVMADGVEHGEAPRSPYVGGYGKRIPTPWKLLYQGYWRRVYCCCYGNAGSCYITIKDKDVLVDIET
jgi:hypothetical protein